MIVTLTRELKRWEIVHTIIPFRMLPSDWHWEIDLLMRTENQWGDRTHDAYILVSHSMAINKYPFTWFQYFSQNIICWCFWCELYFLISGSYSFVLIIDKLLENFDTQNLPKLSWKAKLEPKYLDWMCNI